MKGQLYTNVAWRHGIRHGCWLTLTVASIDKPLHPPCLLSHRGLYIMDSTFHASRTSKYPSMARLVGILDHPFQTSNLVFDCPHSFSACRLLSSTALVLYLLSRLYLGQSLGQLIFSPPLVPTNWGSTLSSTQCPIGCHTNTRLITIIVGKIYQC